MRHFAVRGVATVSVAASSPAIAAFLDNYLAPFFAPSPAAGDRWEVLWDIRTSRELDRILEGEAATSTGQPSHPDRVIARSGKTWKAWHRDRATDGWTVEELDETRRRLTIHILEDSGSPQYIIGRAVRSLLVTLACSSGWAQVHASAFAFGEQAVLVIGDKGAGKTSMLLTALAEGADFMSNDRALLGRGDGTVMVRGLPHSVTVRAGTEAARVMRGTPTTYGDHQPAGTGQVRYQIADVLSATGRSVCPEAGLALLVLPHVATGDLSLERMDTDSATALLEGARRRSTSPFDPLWDAWRPHVSDIPSWPSPSAVRIGYDPGDLRAAMKLIQNELAR